MAHEGKVDGPLPGGFIKQILEGTWRRKAPPALHTRTIQPAKLFRYRPDQFFRNIGLGDITRQSNNFGLRNLLPAIPLKH